MNGSIRVDVLVATTNYEYTSQIDIYLLACYCLQKLFLYFSYEQILNRAHCPFSLSIKSTDCTLYLGRVSKTFLAASFKCFKENVSVLCHSKTTTLVFHMLNAQIPFLFSSYFTNIATNIEEGYTWNASHFLVGANGWCWMLLMPRELLSSESV